MPQLEIEFEEVAPANTPQLKDLTFGQVFKFVSTRKTNPFMKVKSVNFLNNSNLLSDVFARGDCLVVDIVTGNLRVAQGSLFVEKLSGKITLHKEKQ